MRQTKCQTRDFAREAPPLPSSGRSRNRYVVHVVVIFKPTSPIPPVPFHISPDRAPIFPCLAFVHKALGIKKTQVMFFFFGRDFWTCLIWMIKGCFQIIYQIFQVISLLEVDAGHCQ